MVRLCPGRTPLDPRSTLELVSSARAPAGGLRVRLQGYGRHVTSDVLVARAIFFAFLAGTLACYLVVVVAVARGVARSSRRSLGHHLTQRRTRERAGAT